MIRRGWLRVVLLCLGLVGSLSYSGGSASAQGDVFERTTPTTTATSTTTDDCGASAYVAYNHGYRTGFTVVDAYGCNPTETYFPGDFVGWSPDGTRIVYSTSDGLWIVDSDGSNPIKISEVETAYAWWSPDGSRIVYSTSDGLWIVDSDGSNPIKISEVETVVRRLAWSPDGTRIVHETGSGQFIVDADGSKRIRITESGFTNVGWSPDGTRFVYAAEASYTHTSSYRTPDELWIVDGDGSNPTIISTDYTHSYSRPPLVWSPDGSRIAYRASDGFRIVDSEGFNPIKIIDAETVLRLAWSPDGTRILYAKDSYWSGLWVADADGSNPTQIVDYGSFYGWSPDGTRISYARRPRLWVADADGSGKRIVSWFKTFYGWSPDGTRIAYSAYGPGPGDLDQRDTEFWVVDVDGGSKPTKIASKVGAIHGWAPVLVTGAATGSVSSDGLPSVAVSRGSVENDFEICRVGAAVCSWVVGSGSGWTPGEEFFVRCGDFVDTSRDVPVVYRDRYVDSGGNLSWGESICYSNGAHVVEVWTGVDGSVSVMVPVPDGTVPATSPPSSTVPTTDPVVPASLPEIAFVGHRLVEGKPVMTFPPPAGAVSYDLRYRASSRLEWTVVEGIDIRCRRGINSTNWCSYFHPVAAPDGWRYALRGVSSSGRGPWSASRMVDVPPPVSQPVSSPATGGMSPPSRHPVLRGDNRLNVQGGSITVDVPVLEPVGSWNVGSDGGAHRGKFRYTKSDPNSANSATWYFQDHDQVLSSGRYRIEVFIPNRWRASFWRNKDADPLPTATAKYSIYLRNSTDGAWTRLNTFSVDQSNRGGWVRLGNIPRTLQYFGSPTGGAAKGDDPTGQLAVKLEARDATGGVLNVDRMRVTFVSLTDADQKKVTDRAAVLAMRQSLEEKALLGGANLDDSLRYLCGQLDSGTPRGEQVKQNLEARGVIKGQWGVYRAAAELGLNYYKGHWKSVLSTALNRAGLNVASLVVGLIDVAGAVDDFNKLMQADYLTEVGIETKACPLQPWDPKWA